MRKGLRTTLLSKIGLCIIFAASAVPTSAQVDDIDLEKRIFNLGILRKGKSDSGKKHGDPKKLLAQVQADFTALQVTNNSLAEAVEKKHLLDLDVVTKSASEIRVTAVRLMENLTELKVKNKKPQTAELAKDHSQLKEQLAELDRLVVKFAHNRVFVEETPDDQKLAAEALRDLDQIIEVSGLISIGSEKLKTAVP